MEKWKSHLDFLTIKESYGRSGLTIKPDFKSYPKSKDLMVKNQDFYAIYNSETGLWSREEDDCLMMIDSELTRYCHDKNYNPDFVDVQWLVDTSNGGIDRFHKYVKQQLRDNYKVLNQSLVFNNTPKSKELYASFVLPYNLEEGSTEGWDELINTLYSPEEVDKIEYIIGSIVSGESKKLQKFAALYGEAGTGKGTVLAIIDAMFSADKKRKYTTSFSAARLTSRSNQFPLEPFKNNPLIAIDPDGDMAYVEDNTIVNQLVSHETMTVNLKSKSTFEDYYNAFLLIATNKPIKITDARSGLIRRLIDISPTGDKIPQKQFDKLRNMIDTEYGAIAYKCLQIFRANPNAYDHYIPIKMMGATNHFYNFIIHEYSKYLNENETTGSKAWEAYNMYCSVSGIPDKSKLTKMQMKEELKPYFKKYYTKKDGVFDVYVGFKKEKFEQPVVQLSKTKISKGWLSFDETTSILDCVLSDCPAQLCLPSSDGSVKLASTWDNCETKLKDINTNELHMVRPPVTHVVIDIDKCSPDGKKDTDMCIKIANNWPPTYAELSKGGGVHLHYNYVGDDPEEIVDRIDEDVEIKVFRGKLALRRRLSLCNDLPIASIDNLPKKERKEEKNMSIDTIKDEGHLYNLIKKGISVNEEGYYSKPYGSTKVTVAFIDKLLTQAYESGMDYDANALLPDVLAFAMQSTHWSDQCQDMVYDMKWQSKSVEDGIVSGPTYVSEEDKELCFYDIECYPNFFHVSYRIGMDPVKYHISMFEDETNIQDDIIKLINNYKLIGYNNRKYDNHMIYAAAAGYDNMQLYQLSNNIIKEGVLSCGFVPAYNISYTDIFDYLSQKHSLKWWEYELHIMHKECSYQWDEPLKREAVPDVISYCDNDVDATYTLFYSKIGQTDFLARTILADIAGGNVNMTTNSLSLKVIFKDEKKPQDKFLWRDLSKPVYKEDLPEEAVNYIIENFPKMVEEPHGEAGSFLPYWPLYTYDRYGKLKSHYDGEYIGEGGLAKGYAGYYVWVALLDIASMHPTSIRSECEFGYEFTLRFDAIVKARLSVKHGDWDTLRQLMDGAFAKYTDDIESGKIAADDLATALKIVINSVYGLTAAKFDNPCRDPENIDNIVAKRGAVFMASLERALKEIGWNLCHIKTDSVKIPNATPEVIKFVMDFGEKHGYTFEHEATYERMVLVNDAVYIAKYASEEDCKNLYGYAPKDNRKHPHQWTATGAEFQIPYIFKTLFSKEDLDIWDYQVIKEVTGKMYIDDNYDLPDVTELEKEYAKVSKKGTATEEELTNLKYNIAKGHNFKFIGKIGGFIPTIEGGTLWNVSAKTKGFVTGTKGYRFTETMDYLEYKDSGHIHMDLSFWQDAADKAKKHISEYVDYDVLVSEEPINTMDKDGCSHDCTHCQRLKIDGDAAYCMNKHVKELASLNEYSMKNELVAMPF